MGRTDGAPLRFDMLVSTDVRNAIQAAMYDPRVVEFQRQGWAGGSAITYLVLPDDPAVSAGDLERRFGDFVTRRVPETQRATMDVTFGLLPVRDLLRTSVDAELFSGDFGVSVSSVLLTLGALVLAIACVNYANLATARAARRLREVGLRKALGAAPAQIALQHLLEAAMLTVAALAGALVLLRAALPVLETISGMSLGAVLFDGPRIWLFATAIGAAATLAAGTYPALAMARVGPIAALRAAAPLGAKRLAAVLVGVQFAAASLLVIAVTVIALQNDRLVETGLGAVTDPLVLIENQSRVTNVDARTLRAELSHLPQVKGVTEAGGLPWQRLVAITFLRAEPDESARLHRVLVRSVGYDFFAVLGIELLAGRVFDAARGDDARREPQVADAPRTPTPIVVDRTFVEQFGLGSPEEAIGRSIYSLSAAGEGAVPQQIVGVVENRRLTFRGAGAEAAVYGLTAEPTVTYVRVAASEIGAALEGIDRLWSRLAPNVAISRQFFDEAFNQAYERFARLNQVFGALSLMALAISTAGLVGMATLVAGQRRREIGVRKTLGASAARMVRMLLGTFLRPVIIANAIVWPLAYLAAREYLAAFLDPVPLNALPFVLAFGVTLLIAALASGVQTIRAARSKPADVLRNE
jgi:putative ABC transport system permease protein